MNFHTPTGPKLRRDGNARGVFNPSDFDFLMKRSVGSASIYHYNYHSDNTLVGTVSTVYRKGSELKFQHAHLSAKGCSVPTVQRTDCGGEGGGYCPRTICPSEENTRFDVVMEYSFRNCR